MSCFDVSKFTQYLFKYFLLLNLCLVKMIGKAYFVIKLRLVPEKFLKNKKSFQVLSEKLVAGWSVVDFQSYGKSINNKLLVYVLVLRYIVGNRDWERCISINVNSVISESPFLWRNPVIFVWQRIPAEVFVNSAFSLGKRPVKHHRDFKMLLTPIFKSNRSRRVVFTFQKSGNVARRPAKMWSTFRN